MPTVGQGMMIAGNALAQAMMQRKMKKQQEQRMMALAELLAGPEVQAQQIDAAVRMQRSLVGAHAGSHAGIGPAPGVVYGGPRRSI